MVINYGNKYISRNKLFIIKYIKKYHNMGFLLFFNDMRYYKRYRKRYVNVFV